MGDETIEEKKVEGEATMGAGPKVVTLKKVAVSVKATPTPLPKKD